MFPRGRVEGQSFAEYVQAAALLAHQRVIRLPEQSRGALAGCLRISWVAMLKPLERPPGWTDRCVDVLNPVLGRKVGAGALEGDVIGTCCRLTRAAGRCVGGRSCKCAQTPTSSISR